VSSFLAVSFGQAVLRPDIPTLNQEAMRYPARIPLWRPCKPQARQGPGVPKYLRPNTSNVIYNRTLHITKPYTFCVTFASLVNTVLYTSINTNLAFSEEALVALAIDAFEKSQKKVTIYCL
jgi:hypothetical protein